MVRCSSCGERWFVPPRVDTRPGPAPAAATPPADAPPAARPEPAPIPPAGVAVGKPAPRRRSPLLGWLLLTLLVLLAAALLVGRNEVVARFPAILPLYERLGVPVRLPAGVEFRNLTSLQRVQEGRRQLVVSGEIANVAGEMRDVPPIRVGLLDGERREIDASRFDPPQPALEPGAVAHFEVAIDEPPAAAESFTVSFGETP
jgi:hypothetical protein